jgi:peroxiredoxin
LPSTQGKPVKLSDYLGKKNVVLAFFPAAFTGG